MNERFLNPLILTLSIALLASCATFNKKKNQEITINSNVPGALVEVDGVEIGYTPFKGKIKTYKVGRVKVSKPGYFAGELEVRKEENYKDLIGGNVSLGFASVKNTPYSWRSPALIQKIPHLLLGIFFWQ